MIHVDEKFKDASPVTTVENIRRMLNEHNIDVSETWMDSGIDNCFSVRVSVAGTTLSSFGKGVTRELARASGHAELMERLQSGYLCPGKLAYPDSRKMTRDEVLSVSGSWLQIMADSVAASEHTAFSVDSLLDNVFSYGNDSVTDAIPFYNANDGSKVYIPENLIPRLYSSNGLAAGNSQEEALVQGFSEVVERYCHCRIIREGITPPSVPDDYLQQFRTAYSIISAMRKAGYTVIIKDCSLGEGYPVVASVVIDAKRHGYRVNVGSSPVFEIALERCLTEIMQGRNISTLPMISSFASKKHRSAADITFALVSGNGIYPVDFFEGEPDYSFVPFPDRSSTDNKHLLAYIMDYLRQHDRTMLVRDLSHFGFHTYRIIVPGISEVFGFSFVGSPSLYRMGYETRDIRANPKKASPEQLFIYSMLYRSTPAGNSGPLTLTNHTQLALKLSPREDRFLGLIGAAYVEWQLGNFGKAQKYLQTAVPYVSAENAELIDCLNAYLYNFLLGYSSEDVLKMLRVFFAGETLARVGELVKDNANPFEKLFPLCDRNCQACRWADVCSVEKNEYVRLQINKAVAEFDSEASFARFQNTFASLQTE